MQTTLGAGCGRGRGRGRSGIARSSRAPAAALVATAAAAMAASERLRRRLQQVSCDLTAEAKKCFWSFGHFEMFRTFWTFPIFLDVFECFWTVLDIFGCFLVVFGRFRRNVLTEKSIPRRPYRKNWKICATLSVVLPASLKRNMLWNRRNLCSTSSGT